MASSPPPPTQTQKPNLTVLEISHISPPQGSVPETSLPFTFFDIGWLYLGPVERIFFYSFPYPTSHFIDNILPIFKSSLSLTLHHFFPLAGKIRSSPDNQDLYELHYTDGDSVTLTVAEHVNPQDFHELSNFQPRDINRLLPLVPDLPTACKAVALQVTLFSGHGLAVGVSVNHAACDGSSSMRFVSTWANACKTSAVTEFEVAPPPVFDRTLISDPLGLYNIHLTSMRKLFSQINAQEFTPSNVVASTAQLVSATFTLTTDQIQRLKQLVITSSKNSSSSAFLISTIVVTYAYAWVCLVKARGWPGDRTAYIAFAVDCRRLLSPPVPSTYFGNCVQACAAEGIKTSDLVGEDGFVTAAVAIAKAIKEFKDDVLKDVMTFSVEKFMEVQPLTVAGSPKFRVYDVDFGWGRPVKVELTSVRNGGAMALAESREGGGGVEIGFVMPKHEMDEFAAHFSDGLKLL